MKIYFFIDSDGSYLAELFEPKASVEDIDEQLSLMTTQDGYRIIKRVCVDDEEIVKPIQDFFDFVLRTSGSPKEMLQNLLLLGFEERQDNMDLLLLDLVGFQKLECELRISVRVLLQLFDLADEAGKEYRLSRKQ